jgi:hypothetical protein
VAFVCGSAPPHAFCVWGCFFVVFCVFCVCVVFFGVGCFVFYVLDHHTTNKNVTEP